MRIVELKAKIKMLEKYLGAKTNYGKNPLSKPENKDYWPIRWVTEYLGILKTAYYRRLRKKKL